MKIRLFTLFQAGSTGYVFLFKKGKRIDKGLAFSGYILPQTTVAVVPTSPQIVDFAIEAKTSDKQSVTVSGSLTTKFVPAVAVANFDFTVEPRTGGYVGNWVKILNSTVIAHIVREVLSTVKTLDIEMAIVSQDLVEKAITQALGEKTLSAVGLVVESCSIPSISADDDEVEEAIGAEERQAKLAMADEALHVRRLKASESDRVLKAHQAETNLQLERERAKLVEQQGFNVVAMAEAEARATEVRLTPLKEVPAGILLGAALLRGCEPNGSVRSVAITTELLASLQGSVGKNQE